MIDDLINKGTDEPYRMFTSRAEYRLLLRQDNADSRLMPQGRKLGLLPEQAWSDLQAREELIKQSIEMLRSVRVPICDVIAESEAPRSTTDSAIQLLKRPEIFLKSLLSHPALSHKEASIALQRNQTVLERVEIEVKYEGYIKRQDDQIRQYSQSESIHIPTDFNFLGLRALSREGKEKLHRVRPTSIGQASRISGVTPADITVVMIALMS